MMSDINNSISGGCDNSISGFMKLDIYALFGHKIIKNVETSLVGVETFYDKKC